MALFWAFAAIPPNTRAKTSRRCFIGLIKRPPKGRFENYFDVNNWLDKKQVGKIERKYHAGFTINILLTKT